MASDEVRRLLKGALPGTRDHTIRYLADHAVIRSVPNSEIVFRQGDSVRLFLITRGYGAFRRTTVDGQQVVVGLATPGDLMGLTNIAATISSVEFSGLADCELALWPGLDVRQVVASDPGLALDIIDRMAAFLDILTQKVDGFLHQDARRRVVRILARHRDLFFGEPPIVSRAILPGLVGTSREMTGRVLRELERDQTVVRVGRTGLRLLRPDRLDPDVETRARDAS